MLWRHCRTGTASHRVHRDRDDTFSGTAFPTAAAAAATRATLPTTAARASGAAGSRTATLRDVTRAGRGAHVRPTLAGSRYVIREAANWVGDRV